MSSEWEGLATKTCKLLEKGLFSYLLLKNHFEMNNSFLNSHLIMDLLLWSWHLLFLLCSYQVCTRMWIFNMLVPNPHFYFNYLWYIDRYTAVLPIWSGLVLSGPSKPFFTLFSQDQSICSFYSRYGICKYGPACKFDHPENWGDAAPSIGARMVRQEMEAGLS